MPGYHEPPADSTAALRRHRGLALGEGRGAVGLEAEARDEQRDDGGDLRRRGDGRAEWNRRRHGDGAGEAPVTATDVQRGAEQHVTDEIPPRRPRA